MADFGSLGTAYSCARDGYTSRSQIEAASRVRDARYRSPTPLFVLRIRPLAAIRPFGSRPDASHRLAATEHWGRVIPEADKLAGPAANLDGSECSTVRAIVCPEGHQLRYIFSHRSVDAPAHHPTLCFCIQLPHPSHTALTPSHSYTSPQVNVSYHSSISPSISPPYTSTTTLSDLLVANTMGLPVRENSPDTMPSTLSPAAAQQNGDRANGTSTPAPYSANDNIRRFDAPSGVGSPLQDVLFHNKTRCFV